MRIFLRRDERLVFVPRGGISPNAWRRVRGTCVFTNADQALWQPKCRPGNQCPASARALHAARWERHAQHSPSRKKKKTGAVAGILTDRHRRLGCVLEVRHNSLPLYQPANKRLPARQIQLTPDPIPEDTHEVWASCRRPSGPSRQTMGYRATAPMASEGGPDGTHTRRSGQRSNRERRHMCRMM